LAAGLPPDSLGKLKRSPRPLATWGLLLRKGRGWGRREGEDEWEKGEGERKGKGEREGRRTDNSFVAAPTTHSCRRLWPHNELISVDHLYKYTAKYTFKHILFNFAILYRKVNFLKL